MWQFLGDLGVNICADIIFVVCILLILWGLEHQELEESRQFFGLNKQTQIRIFVSAFEHEETVTKKVIAVLEYEAALEFREAFKHLSGDSFISRVRKKLAGIAGQSPEYLEVIIDVSPLEGLEESPYSGSLISVGGPLRNQLAKFYMRNNPFFRFDEESGRFFERIEGQYQAIDNSHDVAVLEKMMVAGQTVFLAFGTGERHTRSALQHLRTNWQKLSKEYPGKAFGIRLSGMNEGKVRVEKVLVA